MIGRFVLVQVVGVPEANLSTYWAVAGEGASRRRVRSTRRGKNCGTTGVRDWGEAGAPFVIKNDHSVGVLERISCCRRRVLNELAVSMVRSR